MRMTKTLRSTPTRRYIRHGTVTFFRLFLAMLPLAHQTFALMMKSRFNKVRYNLESICVLLQQNALSDRGGFISWQLTQLVPIQMVVEERRRRSALSVRVNHKKWLVPTVSCAFLTSRSSKSNILKEHRQELAFSGGFMGLRACWAFFTASDARKALSISDDPGTASSKFDMTYASSNAMPAPSQFSKSISKKWLSPVVSWDFLHPGPPHRIKCSEGTLDI